MPSTTSIESTSYTLKLNANSQKRHHKLKQDKQRFTQSNAANICLAYKVSKSSQTKI